MSLSCRKTLLKRILEVLFLSGFACLPAVGQTPSISSLSVTSGVTGTAVTITGANFGTSQGTVTFNGTAAAVSSWSSGSIGVTVPAAATTGSVVVKAGGVASNGVTFTVVPNISGLLVNGAPSNTGPIGATVTVNGTGFGNTAGFSTVTLNTTLNTVALAGNGVRATSWSDQSIVVVIPSTATSGNIVVKVGSQSSGGVRFTIGPVITGVSSSSGLAGSAVTVTGSGFGTATGTVTFNGQGATVSGWGQNSITAVVPSGATAGPIVVTVAGVASNNSATFTPTPAITSLSPSSGLSGTQVTIAGSSFGNQQGTSTVSFNGVAAAVSNWTNTGITVTAPSGALTGNVQVAVNGVSSAGVPFTFTPVITSITPSPALAQTPVVIGGNNFGGSQSTSTVTFNGVSAAVNNWTNTSITATVPGNATGGPVVVTVNGVGSNGLAFNLPPPYSFSIGYAPNGNVRSAQDSVNGNWTYSYDDFNRLAGSTNSTPLQAFSYTYDQYGNRWQQNVTAGSGNGSLLTFTSASTAVANGNCYHAAGLTNQPDGYCFDAAGNLLGDGQHNYTYDAENRIIAVDGGQTATYLYNGSGQRIRKVSATARTADYVYDLAGRTVTEVSGQGTWMRLEVYVGGRHLATYNNGTVYFVQADWEGTERARVLISGDLFEVCTSLPYGDGQQCTGSSDPSPDHLTGKQRDTETGLDYFGARYYASSSGRWTSPDLILVSTKHLVSPQRWNRYAYVRNNPLTLFDPDGLEDFYVFRQWASSTSADWKRVQAEAEKHGNHVYVFNNAQATVDGFVMFLSTKGAHLVDSGHTYETLDNGHLTARSVHLNDGNVGTIGDGVRTIHTMDGPINVPDPEPVANVQASTVGVFGCNSKDLQPQYANTTYTGVDSGPDQETSIGALDDAALAYTSVLSTGGTIDAATTAATKALPKNNAGYESEDTKHKHLKNVQDGDHAVTTPKKDNL